MKSPGADHKVSLFSWGVSGKKKGLVKQNSMFSSRKEINIAYAIYRIASKERTSTFPAIS
jgi:hypothetical protein